MPQDKPKRSWQDIAEELTENCGPRFNELVEELNQVMQEEECQKSRIVAEPNTTHI